MKRYAIALFSVIPSVAMAQGPQGEWEPWFWFGAGEADASVAINLIHVWDGQTTKVLALQDYVLGTDITRLWTPASAPGAPGTYENMDAGQLLFCGGASAMADGRILHVGGNYVNYVNIFDPFLPVGSQWNNPPAPDMMFDRLYSTSTTLADGRVLIGDAQKHSCNNLKKSIVNHTICVTLRVEQAAR